MSERGEVMNAEDPCGIGVGLGTDSREFFGTVFLKDWMPAPDGRLCRCVTGVITVHSDKQLVGFSMRGTDSNWAVRITGHKELWTILGCQIRAFVGHPSAQATNPESYVVK
jgi:hypothetical protein